MKIRIELNNNIAEEEIIIHCNSLTPEVQKLQQIISEHISKNQRFVFFKGDIEYYFSLEDILFFETSGNSICAHTISDVYQIKYRLYELEEFLPGHFMRISKSTILNTNKVYSINKNITASSIVEFQNTHKQVFVSRHYYKPLKNKLEEKRFYL